MPAEYKYPKPDSRRHYNSSSSSGYDNKERDNKKYRANKYYGRSRQRSRQNQVYESNYKYGYHNNSRDDRKQSDYNYEYRKESDCRRRQLSEEKRDRREDKKSQVKFAYHRGDDRNRSKIDKDSKKDEKYDKYRQNSQSKSSSSESKQQQQRRYQAKTKNGRQQKMRQNNEEPIKKIEQNRFTYVRQQSNQRDNVNSKKQQTGQKQKYITTNISKGLDVNIQQRQKFMMKMPPPPPPARFSDEREIKKGPLMQQNYQRYEKQEDKQSYPSQTQIPPLRQTSLIQNSQNRISPIKRSLQDITTTPIQTVIQKKGQISKFDMIMTEAKSNLLVPLPPVNILAVDAFQNMNKFQTQTYDRRWVDLLQSQADRFGDLKAALDEVKRDANAEPQPSRLWMFLKQQINEAQQDLKLRLQELKINNMNLSQLSRKLRLIN